MRAKAAWVAAITALCCVVASGCSGQGSAAEAGSIEEFVEQVADVRELGAPEDFDVRYLPRSEVPALLDDLITDEDRELFDETTRLYRLLGYLDNDEEYYDVYRSFGASAILGLYAPDRDTLWVVHGDDEPGTFESLSEAQLETLAHEVVHVLQDYHFNLDEDYYEVAADLDRALAWTAIIEGDARVHEEKFSRDYLAVPLAGPGGPLLMAAGDIRAQAARAILRELYFPYTTGPASVNTIIGEMGLEAIDRLLADPPAGTAFILHPERLKDGWQPEQVAMPDLAAVLGSGWERDSGGTFGEFHVSNYLQLERSADEATAAADGWAGDHYDVYTDGEESVAVFRLVFADEDEAAEFAREHAEFADEVAGGGGRRRDALLLTPLGDGDVLVRADLDGREAIFAVGSDEETAVRAIELLLGG